MRMKDDQLKFLSVLDLMPARFTAEQTAWALNFQEHDIPILVMTRLLKPLGNPPANGAKHFAAVYIAELARDPQWLAKATNAVHEYWHGKNHRKKGRMPRLVSGVNHQSTFTPQDGIAANGGA